MQQISTKSTNEKSKLERYKIIITIQSNLYLFSFSEYRKKCDIAKARLDSLQQKEKQYRELMIKIIRQ